MKIPRRPAYVRNDCRRTNAKMTWRKKHVLNLVAKGKVRELLRLHLKDPSSIATVIKTTWVLRVRQRWLLGNAYQRLFVRRSVSNLVVWRIIPELL
jgi:hypothetical protein